MAKRELNHRLKSLPVHSAELDDKDEKYLKIAAEKARQQLYMLKRVSLLILSLATLCFTVNLKGNMPFERKLVLTTTNEDFPRVIDFAVDDSFSTPPKNDHRVSFFFPEVSPSTETTQKRTVTPMITAEQIEALEDSREYDSISADDFETKECKAQYAWQMDSKPTCNSLHEMDRAELPHGERPPSMRLVNNGYWRDVWKVRGTKFSDSLAFKSLRYEHDTTPRNFDRNRRDAVAMERLTSSPWVLNIYGYCGNSGLSEFAGDGTIADRIWPTVDGHRTHPDIHEIPLDFLGLAIQATLGMAATHNSDVEGVPAIAHTDITPSQFVISKKMVKLNDFNRARFLRWNVKKNRTCTYHVGNNPGNNRSPEEYAYKPQTEKVDIYSLGNVFYMLVSHMWPLGRRTEKEARNAIKHGTRPPIPNKIINSTNPVHQTLFKAIEMCWVQDPTKRATAREVQGFLIKSARKIAPEKLDEWGITEVDVEVAARQADWSRTQ